MSTIVYRTWSDLEAQLIKGILELYGIPVSLSIFDSPPAGLTTRL